VLGYRYEDSPVITSDGTDVPARDFLNYVPSARPGSLAPHAWLHDGSSLYDHFGHGFTLLITDGSDSAAADHLVEAARLLNVPLKTLRPTGLALADLYRARYALIRPDQHVAWRGNALPEDAARLLLQVTGQQYR
jgi:hypothetical protein